MRRQQAGFTLIELVIVIILLGIIGATITPRFVNIQDNARQAVVDAAAGAVTSTALLQFAEANGTATSAASVLAGTDGVDSLANCGGVNAVAIEPALVCGAGDVNFTVVHCDATGTTAAGVIPDGLCL